MHSAFSKLSTTQTIITRVGGPLPPAAMLFSINRVISLKNCFLGLKRKSQKSLHSSGSAIIAPWLLLFLLPLVRKGFRPPAYLANLPAITMTDIARPCNPVLSFSSFNDEPVAYGTRALPPDTIVEMEIPSPRTTITAGRFEIDDDNGRSKSAPPSHFVSENKDPTSSLLLLPSTYDPRQRPESTPARALPHDCQTKFADEDPDVDEVPAVAIVPSVNASDYILYFNQNFVLFGDTVNKYKNSLRHVILLKS